ncbi:hypothetical protein L3X38_022433 [Prunus dulcis]|uniref:BSD domain-containing protein n=1 Tax=Prunus dulcis TaxID=3755 RepID=A0AAD4Z4K9_PRUDU|nr:hypothetical protein L3X38_022433 [Prunus dulcis]
MHRMKLLQEDSELEKLHVQYVISGGVLTEAEFWAARKKFGDYGDSNPKQKLRVGFKSSMIMDTKPMTDGRTNKVTFSFDSRDKVSDFCPETIWYAAAAEAEAAEDEELAMFLKQDEYVQCLNSCSSEEEAVSKRRELSKENTDGEEVTANSEDTNDDLQKGPPLSPAKVDGEGDTSPLL